MLPSSLKRLWLPRHLFERSWNLVRAEGRGRVESEVVWGGRCFGDEGVVLSVVTLLGEGVAHRAGGIGVGVGTIAAMGRWFRGADGQVALAQVHSHPGKWVDHSPTDDASPIASDDGFLSIVWPHFCQGPLSLPAEWGIHEIQRGRWRRWSRDETARRLVVVESEAVISGPDRWPLREAE